MMMTMMITTITIPTNSLHGAESFFRSEKSLS